MKPTAIALVWIAAGAAFGVSAPYGNDFNAGDVSDFTEIPDPRWSPSGGRYRFLDSHVDTTHFADAAVVRVDNLGGVVRSNFAVTVKFSIASATESPGGTGERLAVGVVCLANPDLSEGYVVTIGAGEDIPSFEEGMAFYKNGAGTSHQTTNFFIQGPTTDGTETWLLKVQGEYLPADQIRFRFIALNYSTATTVTNEWVDTSGVLATGQTFGVVVAHARYVSTVFFDDFQVVFGSGEPVLPDGVRFRDDFNLPLSVGGWVVTNSFPLWYAVSNGLCHLRAQSGNMESWAQDFWNLVQRPLPPITEADFCATLAVARFEPTNDHTQVALLAWDDTGNFVRASYGHMNGARRLTLISEIDDSPTVWADDPRDFGDAPFWLRLTRQGNAYRMYWSTNGLWFHLAGPAAPFHSTTPAWVAFWTGGGIAWEMPPATVARLEYFEVRDFPEPPVIAGVVPAAQPIVLARNLYADTTGRIERCTSPASNDWHAAANWVIGADSTNFLDSVGTGPVKFYRVRVNP